MASVKAFVTASPDLMLTPRRQYVGNDAVAHRAGLHRNNGPMATADGEVPATGRPVTFRMIDTFVLRDGKVVEHRVYWDNYLFMSQLGLA